VICTPVIKHLAQSRGALTTVKLRFQYVTDLSCKERSFPSIYLLFFSGLATLQRPQLKMYHVYFLVPNFRFIFMFLWKWRR